MCTSRTWLRRVTSRGAAASPPTARPRRQSRAPGARSRPCTGKPRSKDSRRGAVAHAVPASRPSRAQSGLYLTWSDCAQSGNSLSNFDSDCGTTAGFEELYCAFTVPQATGADVLGIVAVIDLQDSASPLPAWWHLEAAGG